MSIKTRFSYFTLSLILFISAHSALSQTTNDAITSSTSVSASDQQMLINYFFAASRSNELDVLNAFLDAGFPINHANAKGYTALMIATYHGHKPSVDLLLARGANACQQDKKGNTALMAAIFRGEARIAMRLMKEDCDHTQGNLAGNTAADFATVFGRDSLHQQLQQLRP